MGPFLVVVSCLVVLVVTVAGQPRVPDATLRVTVQQREAGKLERGFHLLELSCFEGRCWLTSISLNQCGESGQGPSAFYPKVKRTATSDGDLRVYNQGRTLIAQEQGSDIGGDYVNTYRFEYAPAAGGGAATKLLSFTGGAVKNSTLAGRVLTFDFVPLPKPFQVVSFDCGALLPGVGGK